MGYYTQYELKVIEGDENLIAVLREENDHANYAIEDNGNCREECKWCDSDQDMEAFSKKYPEALFQLDGTGEEDGDIWRQWWQNGLCQTTNATIVYEEYDKKKMKKL